MPIERVARLAVSFGLALFLLLGVTTVFAQETPTRPDAPGSLSGQVTDLAGEPLAGIRVYLLDYQDYDRRSTKTDASGAYQFQLLGAGLYRVRFMDPSNFYAGQFYDSAQGQEDAVGIVVAGKDVEGIDAALAPGGGVSGTLSLGATQMPTDHVSASLTVYGLVLGTWSAVGYTSTQQLPADYLIGGLATADYRVCAQAYGTIGGIFRGFTECYDGVASDYGYVPRVEEATDIPVVLGETTANIDIVFGDANDAVALGGRVTNVTGEALSQISVLAQLHDCSYGSCYANTVRAANTDLDGRYVMTDMTPGTYLVRFVDDRNDYVTRYLGGFEGNISYATQLPAEVEQVTLAPYAVRLDLDAELNRAATISGTVTLRDGLPPYFGSVNANPLDFYNYDGYSTAIDGQTGAYTIKGMRPGTYIVSGNGEVDNNYFSKLYTLPGSDQPQTVTLAYGDVITMVDIELDPDAFEGVIEGTVTADGEPLAGIRVHLGYAYHYGYTVEDSMFIYADTDASGNYRIEGLASNGYYVLFADPTEAHATRCTDDPQFVYECQVEFLPPGRVTLTKSVELVRGGTVSGRVTLPLGSNLDPSQYRVVAYQVMYDGEYPFISTGLPAKIDAGDTYRLAGLYPGIYRIGLVRVDSGYFEEIFFYPAATSWWDAEDVTLAAGDDLTGIDLIADLEPVQYLPLIMR